MIRLTLFLAFVVLVALPVLAGVFLPWWTVPIVLVLEMAALVLALPKILKWGFLQFGKKMFAAKSAALKGATAQIHAVQLVPKPVRVTTAGEDDDEDEEDETDPADSSDNDADDEDSKEEEDDDDKTPKRYVQVDVTITPSSTRNSPFQMYDPCEIVLVPYDSTAAVDDFESLDDSDAGSIETLHTLADDGALGEVDDKIAGPAKLRLTFACPDSLRGRAKLRYYFESFGDLTLP